MRSKLSPQHFGFYLMNIFRILASIFRVCLKLPHFFASQKRLASENDASAYYSLLGDDVLETQNEKFEEPTKSLWFNMGYWKNSSKHVLACQDLARLLAKKASLSNSDSVLDAGFGFAEQDILWIKEYDVSRITGINVTRLQVEKARSRVKDLGLDSRIDLIHGSATNMSFASETFDKVLALESAFHFNTRQDFFAGAFKLLKPGGRIALADLLPMPGKERLSLIQRWIHQRIFLPEANVYNRHVYEGKLKSAGFENIQIESITNHTLLPMAEYILHRFMGHSPADISIELSNEHLEQKKKLWIWDLLTGMTDYIVARADKPLR